MSAEVIQRVPLFALLPPDEIGYLTQTLLLSEFPQGSILFKEGDPGDRFSIILEGSVEIVKAIDTPDERVLAVLNPGDIIGEMSLFYQDRIRSASARTRTPTLLLEMAEAEFETLIRRQPVLAFRIMQEMSLRLRNSEDATVRDLKEKNRQLALAYQELQAAQALLIEKEKMEHELQMARSIQESLLPKEIPSLPGWRISAHWQPARAVSGDFYDFIPFPNGHLGLVVGDATDKGVPAALVMAITRSVLRSTALGAAARAELQTPGGSAVPSPGEILAKANDLLCSEMPAKMFVTCLFAILDPDTGQLRYANAGHNLPYQRTSFGMVRELRATGMPLGLMPGMDYEEKSASLADGEYLLLYSDGLVEAHNSQREMFGTPRLREILSHLSRGAEVNAVLLTKLVQFSGANQEPEDDVTLVTLERDSTSSLVH